MGLDIIEKEICSISFTCRRWHKPKDNVSHHQQAKFNNNNNSFSNKNSNDDEDREDIDVGDENTEESINLNRSTDSTYSIARLLNTPEVS